MMNLSPADCETLVERIAGRVVAVLANQPRLVGRYDLAKVLGVSVTTLERLQRDQKISTIRIGRRVLYDPDQVLAELAAAPAGDQLGQFDEASRNNLAAVPY